MKRVFLMVCLVFTLGLTSCANTSSPTQTVESFMKNAQDYNWRRMMLFVDTNKTEFLGLKTGVEDFEQLYGWGLFHKKASKKTTYQMRNIKIEGNEATVSVDITYFDGRDFYQKVMGSVTDEQMEKKDVPLTREEIRAMYAPIVAEETKVAEEALKDAKNFVTVTTEMGLSKTGDTWKISKLNILGEFQDAMTFNFSKE